jgi:hypothetical protein
MIMFLAVSERVSWGARSTRTYTGHYKTRRNGGCEFVSCYSVEGRNDRYEWVLEGDGGPLILQLLSIAGESLRCLDVFRMSQSATIKADPPLRLMRGYRESMRQETAGGPLENGTSAAFFFVHQNLPHSVVALTFVADFTGDSG